MEMKLLCIIVVVTLAYVSGRQKSTSPTSSQAGFLEDVTDGNVPEVCKMNPDIGTERGRFLGWFYDEKIDSCLKLEFGSHVYKKGDVNRFDSLSNCSKTCRPHVPSFCFDEPPKSNKDQRQLNWTYNFKKGKCIKYNGDAKNTQCQNIFVNEEECKQTCRDPDFGPCGKPRPQDCKVTDTIWYRYNLQKETCFLDNDQRCRGENGFATPEECYKRCGRFIQHKCRHYPQNISDWCSTNGERYYYNKTEKRCKPFDGCDEHDIGFRREVDCTDKCYKGKSKSG